MLLELTSLLFLNHTNRLNILVKSRMRLARLDKLRQVAKFGVESRHEKERTELGMKVESRVQKAEANRMHLLKAYKQRRAAKKEQMAQSLMRRMIQDRKYKESLKDNLEDRLQRVCLCLKQHFVIVSFWCCKSVTVIICSIILIKFMMIRLRGKEQNI